MTDIDGTITKSNLRGIILGSIGRDVHHPKVVEFFDKVSHNGYTVIYLTGRPLNLRKLTNKYLFRHLQNVEEGYARYSMPKGPVFLSPYSAMEGIKNRGNENVEKLATLRSLLDLFDLKQDVVVGAYGNAETDDKAYLASGISDRKIFKLNEESEMTNLATGDVTSYASQARAVNKLYPKELF